MLTDARIERYSRQLILPEIGAAGQEKLLAASVALIGAEPVCTSVLLYLSAAGVGQLGIPMPRRAALVSAALYPSNPDCAIVTLNLHHEHLAQNLQPYALVIDASDDSGKHRQINAVCIAARKPLVLGSANGAHGVLSVLTGHRTRAPCYECVADKLVLPEAQDSHLSKATGALIGALLAAEALKLLLGAGTPLIGRLLRYDALLGSFSLVSIDKRSNCAACAASG